jgi:hypothetical protein
MRRRLTGAAVRSGWGDATGSLREIVPSSVTNGKRDNPRLPKSSAICAPCDLGYFATCLSAAVSGRLAHMTR